MLELHLKKPRELELRESGGQPFIKDDEVKIKSIYGGICGSDLSVFKGKLNHATYPVRPGHELLGTIIEKGEDVTYDIGTRVVIAPNTFCGECEYCLQGKLNICLNKQSIGINADGGFAEEFVISSKYILQVPDTVTDKKAILIEPLSVIVHALKKAQLNRTSSVAIMGCGTEGMLAAALANHLGANVTVTDINPLKLDLVRKLGDIKALRPEEISGETFDVVIEAAGVKETFEQGVQLIKPGGAMILIGMAREANFPVSHVVRSEVTIYGSIIYNFPFDFSESLEYLSNSEFYIDPIVSKIVPLADYQQAYEMALSGNYGKVVLDFKEGNRT
ncbi:zinc-dependent alcohol dehydrogenase [Scopulibacillus cellulosilyticus]|uniref:Zinc-binding dehydrogenase n=1 Tax=Scopulibacillus cellulosilyticus TaxID=2665665 RepID=A0ABW2PV65_9BACL